MYAQVFHDSNPKSRRHPRSRQWWLILFSLGLQRMKRTWTVIGVKVFPQLQMVSVALWPDGDAAGARLLGPDRRYGRDSVAVPSSMGRARASTIAEPRNRNTRKWASLVLSRGRLRCDPEQGARSRYAPRRRAERKPEHASNGILKFATRTDTMSQSVRYRHQRPNQAMQPTTLWRCLPMLILASMLGIEAMALPESWLSLGLVRWHSLHGVA